MDSTLSSSLPRNPNSLPIRTRGLRFVLGSFHPPSTYLRRPSSCSQCSVVIPPSVLLIVGSCFGLFGFIVLHMIMNAANIYYWRRYGVNYSFILDLSKELNLDTDKFCLWVSTLESLHYFVFLPILTWKQIRIPKTIKTELLPLFLLVAMFIVLVLPFNFFYRSSRFSSSHVCFTASMLLFTKVTLLDFFLGDQLTSQVQLSKCTLYTREFRHINSNSAMAVLGELQPFLTTVSVNRHEMFPTDKNRQIETTKETNWPENDSDEERRNSLR